MKGNVQESGKKRYEKPNLRVYGDIRTLTQASSGGKTDGGTPPHTMTR